MFRTSTRRTHRAAGPAVIDYRGLTTPVGRTVGGMAVVGAVTATASLQAMGSADAATAPAPAHPSTTAPSAPVAGSAVAAAKSTPAPAAYKNVKLRFGARGSAVSSLQKSLNAKGARLATDGVFGSKTLSAVKSFQRSAGIHVDGVVGPSTWGKLGSSSGSGSSSSSHPKLRSGSSGSAVKTLQRSLNEHGAGISVDGVFGSRTLSSVKAFQRAAGISADGVVGTNTWAKLSSSSANIGGSGGGSSSGSFNGQGIINTARSVKGSPYKWGGFEPVDRFRLLGPGQVRLQRPRHHGAADS
ncbi:peptidoglycan-binding domain-containing protein [Brachybacterium endophyticum]|uniref:peptidoglycan-binding domain-containing protein n=1 Tax=Brachybacterium endophyticum TaxID=2182385 RepID=UPI001F0BC0A4|nr:peptidoglycan-binding protein [Brachybacterium endophyticum]